MPRAIVLDTFPLSSTAKSEPKQGEQPTMLNNCYQWIKDCLIAGNHIVTPAVTYYETLRELERLHAPTQIRRLRAFCRAVPDRYLPITDADIERAAILWAQARNTGLSTASADALDGDAILAAQALNLGLPTSDFIVATTNVGHLAQFVPCDLWSNIQP